MQPEIYSWDELIEKPINAKAKTNLQPFYYNCNINNYYIIRNHPSHIILSKFS